MGGGCLVRRDAQRLLDCGRRSLWHQLWVLRRQDQGQWGGPGFPCDLDRADGEQDERLTESLRTA